MYEHDEPALAIEHEKRGRDLCRGNA